VATDRRPDRALELAVAAASQACLSTEGATVLRRRTSVYVVLPTANAVARVEPADAVARAERQVAAARLLEECAVPAARLIVPDEQPMVYVDGAVTLWRRLTILTGEPSPVTLGHLARHLHEATRGSLSTEIPALDPISTTLDGLGQAASGGRFGGIEDLWEEFYKLAAAWDRISAEDPLGTALVHGDYHVNNVVLTPDGPTLIDLEDSGGGAVSWDLASQMVAVRRFGASPARYSSFCDAYGADLMTWDGAETLCRTFELLLLSWAIASWDISPQMEAEAALRLANFRGETDQPWTLL
jgi:aminoglycoside phosphotransferase (APT) family kinase protein